MAVFSIFNRKSKNIVENVEERRMGTGFWFNSLSNFSNNEAMKLAAFYGAVNLISNSIASMEIGVYKFKDKRKEKLTDSELWQTLNLRPDTKLTHFNFIKMLVESAIIRGNGYALIERDEQLNVTRLQYIEAEFVQPVIQPNGTVKYQVAGLDKLVDDVNMINLFLHVDNTYRGISMLRYMSEVMKGAAGIYGYSNKLYTGGNATGVITADNRLTKEQLQEIRNIWQQAYQSETGIGVAVLPNGLHYQQLQISAQDAELLSNKKYSALDILRFFCVPPSLLGYEDSRSYNSGESDRLSYLQNCLLPWITMIEDQFNLKLVKPSQINTIFCEFDYSPLLRADKKTESEYYRNLLQSGILTPNEVRDKLGYEPLEEIVGNQTYMQLSFGSVADIAEGKYIKGTNQEVTTDNKLNKE